MTRPILAYACVLVMLARVLTLAVDGAAEMLNEKRDPFPPKEIIV